MYENSTIVQLKYDNFLKRQKRKARVTFASTGKQGRENPFIQGLCFPDEESQVQRSGLCKGT
jgi:hypothetical protein